jgi:hypothetical protein
MAFATGFALWKGGWPERIVGAASLVAWVTSLAVLNRRQWLDPQLGVLTIDCIYLALLFFLSFTWHRIWLLFATAFQLLGVVIHIASLVDPGVRTLAYLRGLTIWSYLLLLALAVGTWIAMRDRDRGPSAAQPTA